eukprot:4207075-Amphidinium_carterae.2
MPLRDAWRAYTHAHSQAHLLCWLPSLGKSRQNFAESTHVENLNLESSTLSVFSRQRFSVVSAQLNSRTLHVHLSQSRRKFLYKWTTLLMEVPCM